MAAGALGGGPLGSGRGHEPAVAGPPGGDPQARGRRAFAGGAHLPGQADLSGHSAGTHALFDPGFSGSSFGFRPGRPAHQAVRPRGGASPTAWSGWLTSTWTGSLTGFSSMC